MRAVVQRVTRASVSVNGQIVGSIGTGLCVLLGVTHGDGQAQVEKVARKIAQQRILRDPVNDGAAARVAAEECGAPILLISQFTLYADIRKGRRPGWSHAAPGDVAEPLVAAVARELRTTYGLHVEEGVFGAMMEVELVNDGPFTLLIEA
ncbi:MAG: D-aminoacyl-tRNA deacylase [Ancrocorticia sp.]|jgi:D-tyrosyl-tRNA(Tyr) deacylase|nr:D-aminoacyl-tRNA deacylase [Ancrocorticia sp.]MCI1896427.1 D-aminoacyl-tRNA deacylase [Ancrocorticia sp.]MCI1932620.1 D-aminoacyl-tRNA deacylase [Ancrocorticia sp.]MCI1962577.1 D-aminoacyl-tRNA deacylase [Ancrocorticia sp.]MCI2002494.1 D-aminoacyl-tRNA deacylase [Ancrocorticia sp.]